MYTIALAGNPNVGKSTVFNALTGMHQHTGNWSGKTVELAKGIAAFENQEYLLVDLPGTYSLAAQSAEEECARDYLCFSRPDAVIVVCDATCLERTLGLALQIQEVVPNMVLCINLMDEARAKGIEVDCAVLQQRMGVPVVAASARSGQGLGELMQQAAALCSKPISPVPAVRYEARVERLSSGIYRALCADGWQTSARWLSLHLLDTQDYAYALIQPRLWHLQAVRSAAVQAQKDLEDTGCTGQMLQDSMAEAVVRSAERLCDGVVVFGDTPASRRDRAIDRLLLGKYTGIPIMAGLLLVILWITISGANIPSQMLSDFLMGLEQPLHELLRSIGVPVLFAKLISAGMYRVTAWVISVMLPPMTIFFPLFTLLEDLGYLPRVAFQLDSAFARCGGCGKQALTMCMGLGCNAVGVTGCRIIDSPRERTLAVLTNNFMPCNGRLPHFLLWK